MTEHAMQSASIGQSLTKEIEPFERGSALPRNSAKAQARAPRPARADGKRPAGPQRPLPVISPPLSKTRGFPPRTGIRPVLALIYQDYQVGCEGARREPRRAYWEICASRSNSRSEWRRDASAKRI